MITASSRTSRSPPTGNGSSSAPICSDRRTCPPSRETKPDDGARCRSVRAEILDVHVRAQPDVVGQVPSHVIGIDIDHDLIGIPQPVIAEGEIVLRHIEEEPAEPEAPGASATQPKDIARSESTSETTVLPRVIEMIVIVAPARAMPDPAAVRVPSPAISHSCRASRLPVEQAGGRRSDAPSRAAVETLMIGLRRNAHWCGRMRGCASRPCLRSATLFGRLRTLLWPVCARLASRLRWPVVGPVASPRAERAAFSHAELNQCLLKANTWITRHSAR